jgi:hypothetical protein
MDHMWHVLRLGYDCGGGRGRGDMLLVASAALLLVAAQSQSHVMVTGHCTSKPVEKKETCHSIHNRKPVGVAQQPLALAGGESPGNPETENDVRHQSQRFDVRKTFVFFDTAAPFRGPACLHLCMIYYLSSSAIFSHR